MFVCPGDARDGCGVGSTPGKRSGISIASLVVLFVFETVGISCRFAIQNVACDRGLRVFWVQRNFVVWRITAFSPGS